MRSPPSERHFYKFQDNYLEMSLTTILRYLANQDLKIQEDNPMINSSINILSVRVDRTPQDLKQKAQRFKPGSQKPDSLQKCSWLASVMNSVTSVSKNLGISSCFK